MLLSCALEKVSSRQRVGACFIGMALRHAIDVLIRMMALGVRVPRTFTQGTCYDFAGSHRPSGVIEDSVLALVAAHAVVMFIFRDGARVFVALLRSLFAVADCSSCNVVGLLVLAILLLRLLEVTMVLPRLVLMSVLLLGLPILVLGLVLLPILLLRLGLLPVLSLRPVGSMFRVASICSRVALDVV
jgi:hypothetical protein